VRVHIKSIYLRTCTPSPEQSVAAMLMTIDLESGIVLGTANTRARARTP
jgi:hypothetical protein